MASVSIFNIGKDYESPDPETSRVNVLKDFTLEIKDGEFVSFFGPNGCGKTTLLNAIAGITSVDSGEVRIDGRAAMEARIGYIFQDYRQTLLPWSRVVDNIAYPLYVQRVPRHERRRRVTELLDDMNITLPLEAWPTQLSGGQQQLLVIARALICEPDLMLFDEPFGALDIDTRIQMQAKVQDIWQRSKATILFVSHELDEAILLADRLVMLSRSPAQVRDVLEVEFPRPRRQELLEDESFFHLRKRALRVFREAVCS